MTITRHDQHLVELLCTTVRIATEPQLASANRPNGLRRRLRTLEQRGLIERAHVVVCRPVIEEPLAAVTVDSAIPNFHAVAWQLNRRWTDAPSVRVAVHWATRRAVQLYGGVGGRLRQPFQLAHDLLVTDVFLKHLVNDAAVVDRWLGEDLFRQDEFNDQCPGRIPDALLLDESGAVERVVEIGGYYTPRHLLALHRHCRRRGWSYEIW